MWVERILVWLGFKPAVFHCPDCGYEVEDYGAHKPVCFDRVEIRPGVSYRESWGFEVLPPVPHRKGPPPKLKDK